MSRLYATAILLFACSTGAVAGEIHHTDIGKTGNRYFVSLKATVQAPEDAVRAIMTDYDHLDRLSKSIVSSERLPSEGPLEMIKIISRSCILAYCQDAVRTERIDTQANGDIVATILPDQSDFHSGYYVWRITGISDSFTQIELFMAIEPAFWIPPFIGPPIMQSLLLEDILFTVRQVEILANKLQ